MTLLGSYASILFWGSKCWFEAELLFFVAWWFGINKKRQGNLPNSYHGENKISNDQPKPPVK